MASVHLISVGSRGDLEPYLAILLELQQRGHQVTLIGSINFKAAAQAAGIPFTALNGDFPTLMRSTNGIKLMEGKPIRLVDHGLLRQWLSKAREAIQGCDLLLVPPLALWGYHLAEAENCGFAILSPMPVIGTASFPFLKFPPPPAASGRVRQRLNRLSYTMVRLLKWRQECEVIQDFRQQELGLPRLPWAGAGARKDTPSRLQSPPVLNLYSRHIIERPSDWPEHIQVTGYCFRSPENQEKYTPPKDLMRFLESGTPPFYAGFGSMIPREPERLGAVVVDAALEAGQRLILSPGWGRVVPATSLPDSVYILEDCPHQWLFPQLRGAIHHGGAGTTATTLLCGIPSTVVAFFADQPAWGRTLERLGVSPATHHQTRVQAPELAASIRSLVEVPSYRCRAQELSNLLAQEDGTTTTTNAIEALL